VPAEATSAALGACARRFVTATDGSEIGVATRRTSGSAAGRFGAAGTGPLARGAGRSPAIGGATVGGGVAGAGGSTGADCGSGTDTGVGGADGGASGGRRICGST
jgi:hypothetical protein